MYKYCGQCPFHQHRWRWHPEWEQDVIDIVCTKLHREVHSDLDWYLCSATCRSANPDKQFSDISPQDCPLPKVPDNIIYELSMSYLS